MPPASAHLIVVVLFPAGKPIRIRGQIPSSESFSVSLARGIEYGLDAGSSNIVFRGQEAVRL